MSTHDSMPEIPRDPARGRPIDASNAADLFDVIMHPDDRADGCLAFLFLDERGYLLTPFVVDDPPAEVSRASRSEALLHLIEHCADDAPQVAFARGRAGSLLLRDEDRCWHELVLEVTARAQVQLIGSWLATDAGIRAFPPPLARASA